MNTLDRILDSPVVVIVCRVVIGLVFLAAALAKIGDPGAFSLQIENYGLVPVGYENILAIVLPWIELLTGLSLVLGVRARSGAWMASAMMIVFTLAVLSALFRHLDISCGCFGSAKAARVDTKKLIENLAMTVVAMYGSVRMR